MLGDFNGWNGVLWALRRLDDVGVWEIFVPGLMPGSAYKFEIQTAGGEWVTRADPMARYTERPPATASVVGESKYVWSDSGWLAQRAAHDPHNAAMSVYEMHIGSWRAGLGYRELADQLIEYIHETGFTHVEFMPLAEHPYGPSWGYQVTGYYAPSSRFGHPDDLKYLIDRLHQASIGVIMDWVPGHFPKDEWALGRFDGQAVYEHSDPRRGEHKDWGTYIFNFGDSQVRNFLVANALYWLEEFHIDGLRVDAVASILYLDYSREAGEWEPNVNGGRENLEAISFLQEVNATAYKRNAGIVMAAEESTSYPGVTHPTSEGGLGFGLKWNMGWMHDSLQYIEEDPMYRSYHHNDITFSFLYAFSENFILPISHDEVVYGKGSLLTKMPGDQWQKLANVRAYLAFMWAHPGKQLLFMGSEFGQPSEWSEERSLDWWILDQPAHQRPAHDGRPAEPRLPVRRARSGSRTSTPTGSSGWTAGDAEHNVVSFLRWSTGWPADRRADELQRQPGGARTASGFPSPASGTRSSTRTPPSSAVRESATSESFTPRTSRGPVAPHPRSSPCRRSPGSGSSCAADRRYRRENRLFGAISPARAGEMVPNGRTRLGTNPLELCGDNARELQAHERVLPRVDRQEHQVELAVLRLQLRRDAGHAPVAATPALLHLGRDRPHC